MHIIEVYEQNTHYKQYRKVMNVILVAARLGSQTVKINIKLPCLYLATSLGYISLFDYN